MLFLISMYDLKSQAPDKISKNWSINFVPLIWELFMPNFSFLALKLWEEIEVTANSSPIEKFNSLLTPLALLGRNNYLIEATNKKSNLLFAT